VYCPSCGSTNQNEVKFCRRCGVNLGVVSDALSGRPAEQSQIDERMVKVFKDYYRGRNSVIIGTVASLIALFKVTLFALMGLPAGTGFLGTLAGMFFLFGAIALVWGTAKWNNAASEIKAIGRAAAAGKSLRPAEDHAGLLSGEAPSIRDAAPSTDPLGFPASVTEQTTRHLAGREYQPKAESQAKPPK
jgi:hypothetical protein